MAEKRCGFSRQAHAPKVVGSNPTSANPFFLLSLQWQQRGWWVSVSRAEQEGIHIMKDP